MKVRILLCYKDSEWKGLNKSVVLQTYDVSNLTKGALCKK